MSAWFSKSDFNTAHQCELALWLKKHRREEATPTDVAMQLRFDYDIKVDAYA